MTRSVSNADGLAPANALRIPPHKPHPYRTAEAARSRQTRAAIAARSPDPRAANAPRAPARRPHARRHAPHSTRSRTCHRTIRHALAELRETLAAVRTRVLDIGGPRVDERAVDIVPGAAFPCAEMQFGEPRVDANRAERLGQQSASAQRTRVPSIDASGNIERTHARVDLMRRSSRIAGKRHIALAVADAFIDGHSRVTYQYEVHASPTR